MKIDQGFILVREQIIPELSASAALYRHMKTNTEFLSLHSDDENKVFGITFRTPPKDSSGVAHILEHAVLCGSRKYPVKEPFVELLKGSLQTFLNAFTYPDRTCFPVASQNEKDFYNLVDVYLDAVFYPRLSPYLFQQEGWRLEGEAFDKTLAYQGIVYNEMKGAYSSPDQLLAQYSQESLFPDNQYRFDAGGNPREIVNLGFEEFRDFYTTYYHPSNALVYFYGNDPVAKRLLILNEYFKGFDARPTIDSFVSLQAAFQHPRKFVRPFASGSKEGERERGMVTLNWLLPETTDIMSNLAFTVVEFMLLGMPASPLRKGLIESGLGEDIAGGGLDISLRQMFFSAGLKGVKAEDFPRVESLTFEILASLVRDGIHPYTVEAALNTLEFRLRENNSGHFPRGLATMLRCLTTWAYGGDPLSLVAFEKPLARLKSLVADDNRFFEGVIEQYFVNNQSRATVILEPDPEFVRKREAEELQSIDLLKASMSPSEKEIFLSALRKFKEFESTPDSEEALATIPMLKLEDLPEYNKRIPVQEFDCPGTRIFYHPLQTNRILYLDVGFNLHALPQKYLPYVDLFGRALIEMGTEKEDFVTFSQRISRKTGGIQRKFFLSSKRGTNNSACWLFLRGKVIADSSHELFTILRDSLLTTRLDNRQRFREMVTEAKARMEEAVISSGHNIIRTRLSSHFSEAGWAAERIHGLSYLSFLRNLVKKIDDDWPSVVAELEEVRCVLINKNNMVINMTVDDEKRTSQEKLVSEFQEAFPDVVVNQAHWRRHQSPAAEGMIIPSYVNFVGKGASLYDLGYRFHGSIMVIMRYIRNSWLWQKIRLEGGAYGAFSTFDRLSGVMTFLSYRDPQILNSLDVFDRSAEFLANTYPSRDEIIKNIIGTIGDLDEYLLPDAKGYISMSRLLAGETDEDRQQMRDEILQASDRHFRNFAEILYSVARNGLINILGSEAALLHAASDRLSGLTLSKIL